MNSCNYFYPILDCGGMITALKGAITSPGYPKKYPTNADCYWTVHRPYDKIKLTFLDFKLVSSPKDYVEVKEGPFEKSKILLAKKYGRTRPQLDEDFADRWLWVHFYSDVAYTDVGFQAVHDLYMKRVPVKQNTDGKIMYLS